MKPDSPAPTAAAPPATLVIEAGGKNRLYWGDLWRYRDLFGYLTLRDIKVRYKQTALGLAWAVIQPVVNMVIFTFIFGKVAKMPSGGVPYPLLVLSGLLPWQLFSSALNGSSASLVSNGNLISKVYFPRLIIPLSALGVALVDFMVVLVLYIVMSLAYGRFPSWHWTLLPLFMVAALALAFGTGLWFTALMVKYRDFRYIVPFFMQIGVFVSPIGFSTHALQTWRPWLNLNPMTGVIDAFRWALVSDGQPLDPAGMGFSFAISAVLIFTGLRYFRKMERTFADEI